MTSGRAPFVRRFTLPRADASPLLSLLLLLFAAQFSARPLIAQDTTAATTTAPEEVIRINTDLVSVPVVVADERGRRVANLARDDFAVSDEGRAVEIAYFAAGAEHVALAFLLDASGSARDTIARQHATALALFARFGQTSRVAVIHFREQPTLALPFTTDARAARAAFNIPALPNRRTAIFDAARAAARAFASGGADQQRTERRIVVLISDGLDTVSTTRAADVIAEARERDVSFYVIHLPLFQPRDGRLVARRVSKGFRELAEKTGGQFFTVGDAQSSLDTRSTVDLAPVFRAIAEDLQGQYVLGYYANKTSEPNKNQRRIEVRLASPAKRKLRVRSLREGYTLSKS